MNDLFPEEVKKGKAMFPAAEARVVAARLVEDLRPACERIEIAGSLRRLRLMVHDIDIVAIIADIGKLYDIFRESYTIPKGGEKVLGFRATGIPVDLYLATPETWATILLIRTGSKEHNIKMCQRARSMGMVLHADGRGLELQCGIPSKIEPLRLLTEAEIFALLGTYYQEPWEREV